MKDREEMKLAMSNIAWDEKNDQAVFQILRENHFRGVEIAPTRIFPENPYRHKGEARRWSDNLKKVEGLDIPSMQSIWFGKKERIFGERQERELLIEYTRNAIDFAEQIRCKNLVFGCPRNRVIPEGVDPLIAVSFFKRITQYAEKHHVVIAMEANPLIYHTNYMNTTMETIRLVEKINSDAFRLNLDVGAMIENGETVEMLRGNVHLINHVHISEPGLTMIKSRKEHIELAALLGGEGYEGYISVEMSRQDDLENIRQVCGYIQGVFG